MQYAVALLALGASTAVAQLSSSPPGCQSSFSGTFSFQTANITTGAKMARGLDEVLGRPVARRQVSCGGSVTLTLKDGNLLDSKGRIGYIASNHQFQFDAPVQAGAITQGGFSVCGNGSLALGTNTVFYNCLSGTFDNIYDDKEAAQCYPVTIDTFPCVATGSIATAATSQISPAGESTDSQVSTTSSASSAVSVSATTTAAATSAPAATSVAATPFPVASNGSAVASGTGVATTPAVSPITSATPSAFTGAASVLAIGQGFVALVAAAGAFFML